MKTSKYTRHPLTRSRETLCDDIIDKSSASESYYLSGLPYVGKNGILDIVKERLKKQPGRSVCTRDLKYYVQRQDPERDIWHDVSNWVDRKISVWRKALMVVRAYKFLSIEKTGSAVDELYAWMDKFQASKTSKFNKITLVLLNFDRCVEFENPRNFINDVAFLLARCKEYDISVIIESRQSIDMIERRTTCSFPTGKRACLRPIDEIEIADYLTKSGHSALCDYSEDVLRYSCGIPYLIDAYIASANDARMARGSYFEKLRDFFRSINEDSEFQSEGIENWFDVLTQRETYPEVIKTSPLFRDSVEFYGLGKRRLPKSFSLFGEYLEECLLSCDMQKKITNYERVFRSAISRKLENYYGTSDWFSNLKIPEDEDWGLKSKFHEPFVKHIQKELKKDRPGLIPIQKMDIEDLSRLILLKRHWSDDGSRSWCGFARWFESDAEKCSWAFSALVPCRNRVDHANNPEVDYVAEYKRASSYIDGIVLPRMNADVAGLLGERCIA